MRILDSNLIIYSALPEFAYLRPLLKEPDSHVSAISTLEVLGFRQLDPKSKAYFESVFFSLTVLPISDQVLRIAIDLRQQRKLSLGDAIIAATALHYNLNLHTRNTSDFDWIPNLFTTNPIRWFGFTIGRFLSSIFCDYAIALDVLAHLLITKYYPKNAQ